MKTGFTLRTFAVALACLCTATGSVGLTLGRVQGLALIGQPLELRVPVQFDSSEDAQNACLNAEVAYGENPLDATRVSVAVEPFSDPVNRPAMVRVVATVPVNEPVVTVTLRSGCQVRSSKRYTLLADLPTQVVEQQPVPAPVRAFGRSSPAPREALSQVGVQRPEPVVADAARSGAPRKPQPAPAPVRSVAAAQLPPTVATPPVRLPQPAKTASKARLKLDPLDLLIEKDPVLRATDELLSLPLDDGPRRAEAAALWRALNSSPQQILQDEAQAQRVSDDLKALYTVTNQNQKGLIELATKVERAESERYANGLVYTLGALCLAALAALVWMWQRMHTVQVVPDWRQGQDADDSLMAELLATKDLPQPEAAPARPIEPQPAAPSSAASPLPSFPLSTSPSTEVDFDLGRMDAPWTVSARTPQPAVDPWSAPKATTQDAAHGGIDFSVSLSPSLRSIDTEELEDIRHQAEFFVSLGQHDKAIEILTTRIAQCGESSPLVCLDLLKIYHALGREPEYTFMRAEFQHWFTGRVPVFAEFDNEGRALDRYPQVMERIIKLWPGVRVLEYIEDCLYHHCGTVDGQDFDLQAYRDLLLLHTVAKRILRMGTESGAADSHVPDVVRIPGRAQNIWMSDAPDSRRVPPHRTGTYSRGGLPAAQVQDSNDPQADMDTRGVPLGPMKVPPASPANAGPAKPTSSAAAAQTDFNFLNLR